MTVVRNFVVLLGMITLSLAGSALAQAANIYITQNGKAAGSCTTNVQTPAFFNSPSNWGTGSSQIGPGTVVTLCGTFIFSQASNSENTIGFQIQGAGNSKNPITIQSDTVSPAIIQANAFGGYGCTVPNSNCGVPATGAGIYDRGYGYIVLDGQGVGVVENLSNGDPSQICLTGSNCTIQQSSIGIYIDSTGSGLVTVKNWTVQGIYFTALGAMSGAGIYASTVAGLGTYNLLVQNNLLQDAYNTMYSFEYGSPTVTSTGNTYSDMCHMIESGNGGSTSNSITFLSEQDTVSNWGNWNKTGPNGCHTDGFILYQLSGGVAVNFQIDKLKVSGDLDGGTGAATGYIWCNEPYGNYAAGSGCTVTNSIFDQSSVSTSPCHSSGLVWNALPNSVFYNNTFLGNGCSSGSNSGIGLVAVVPTSLGKSHMVSENNIFSTLTTDYTTLGYFAPLTAQFTTSNNNDFYNCKSSSCFSDGSNTWATLANWQSASGSPDAASSSGNPLLTNYEPQPGSAAIGLGANLTSLNNSYLDVDYGGTTRPASGSWDAGAYQDSSALPNAPTNLTATVQ